MTQIEKYIAELVGNHDCVIIPGLGAFIAQPTSADIHPITHKFTAPGRTLGFNAQIKVNDGLLAAAISRKEGVSFQDATASIDAFVKHFNSSLSLYKHYNFSEIGRFFYNVEGKLEFEPDYSINFSSDSFGFTDFIFKPIERNTYDMNQPTKHRNAKDLSADEQKLKEGEKEKSASFAKILLVLMPLVVLIGAAGFVVYNQQQDVSLGGINVFESLGIKKQVVKVDTISEVVIVDTLKNVSAENIAVIDSTVVTEEVQPTEPIVEMPVIESVKPKVIKEHISTEKVASSNVNSGYYIIVGSFKNESNADKLYKKLSAENKAAVKLSLDQNGFYKIAVGSFDTKEAAAAELSSLEGSYSGTWIKKF
jgi:cell division septation protein DedD